MADNRFNHQFAETLTERNERLRTSRLKASISTLQDLVADLSDALADEGMDWSEEGLCLLRQRVARALPPDKCPDWLKQYRDPPMVQSNG